MRTSVLSWCVGVLLWPTLVMAQVLTPRVENGVVTIPLEFSGKIQGSGDKPLGVLKVCGVFVDLKGDLHLPVRVTTERIKQGTQWATVSYEVHDVSSIREVTLEALCQDDERYFGEVPRIVYPVKIRGEGQALVIINVTLG